MQGTVCPRCAEPVRIPDTSSASQVRCPWCGETYSLDEVTARLPPILEVVDASPMELDLRIEDDPGAYALGASPMPAALNSAPARVAQRPGPRRRSSGSPVISALKIAGGGIVGCFLALLILQYLGRLPDLGVWPFRGRGVPLWESADNDPRGERESPDSGSLIRSEPAVQPDSEPLQTADQPPVADPQELEIPAFPLDSEPVESVSPAAPADSMVTLLAEQADSMITHYQTELADVDQEDRSPEELIERSADELSDTFAGIAQAIHAAPKVEASKPLGLVIERLADELPLLKQVAARGKANFEQATAAETSAENAVTGGLLVGMLDNQADQWVLKRSKEDDDPFALSVPADANENLKAGTVAVVVGVLGENRTIRAEHVQILSPRGRSRD